MSMDLWVFNVGRGLCVAIRSPNGYLCVIDCGRSDDFSPIEWLARQQWTPHKDKKLADLIITHPHVDHLADIENVTRCLKPFMILRREDLDWARVTSDGSGDTAVMTHYVDVYMPPKSEYNQSVTDANKPDWGDGFELRSGRLLEPALSKTSSTDTAYTNNSSFVTIVKYKGYCFAVAGDNESQAMKAFLAQSEGLRTSISSGVHFYLTPHHGHPSGFSSEWFEAAGPTKLLNIASERRKRQGEDDSATAVDGRYSEKAYCEGNNREDRKLVTTKTDGHIYIRINDDGTWEWKPAK